MVKYTNGYPTILFLLLFFSPFLLPPPELSQHIRNAEILQKSFKYPRPYGRVKTLLIIIIVKENKVGYTQEFRCH